MFKNPQDLQKFLAWAQEKKIKEVKIGEIHVVFSELAYIPDSPFDGVKELKDGKSTLTDDIQKEEDESGEDPDLYWSAQ